MKKIIEIINKYNNKINIMEVCGTHTMKIGESGIRKVLSSNINLISGPGCPICVTPTRYIDYIYEISLRKEIIITTYGDMIRIPGSDPRKTLQYAKGKGADVRVILSPLEVIDIAANNKDKTVIFVSIGFETTTPATSILVQEIENTHLVNINILPLNKRIKPAMELLLEDKEIKVDGFLCPGNLAVIVGSKEFDFITQYNSVGVITGFSTYEILSSIEKLIYLHDKGENSLYNDYSYLVSHEGNTKAQFLINKYFESYDDEWRGLGIIRDGSLRLKEKYDKYNVLNFYPINEILKENKKNIANCRCGDVLKGKISPIQCGNFAKKCTPDFPIGPCMVSAEGSCASFYKYR